MAYTLSNVLADFYKKSGQAFISTATDGGVSSIIDTKLGDKYNDDDYEDGGTAIIIRDAAGASAAPENEFSPVSSYDQDSNDFTLTGTLTAAVAAGDTYLIATSTFPLYDMMEAANAGLRRVGYVSLVDVSLSSASNQTEYALPVALRREHLIRVEYQGRTGDADDNRWIQISNPRVVPAAAGSTGLLIIPQLPAGRTIKITYLGQHPALTAFDSVIYEGIHAEVALSAMMAEAFDWYNSRSSGTDSFWLQRQNKAEVDYERAMQRFPVMNDRQQPKYFTGQARLIDPGIPDPILT